MGLVGEEGGGQHHRGHQPAPEGGPAAGGQGPHRQLHGAAGGHQDGREQAADHPVELDTRRRPVARCGGSEGEVGAEQPAEEHELGRQPHHRSHRQQGDAGRVSHRQFLAAEPGLVSGCGSGTPPPASPGRPRRRSPGPRAGPGGTSPPSGRRRPGRPRTTPPPARRRVLRTQPPTPHRRRHPPAGVPEEHALDHAVDHHPAGRRSRPGRAAGRLRRRLPSQEGSSWATNWAQRSASSVSPMAAACAAGPRAPAGSPGCPRAASGRSPSPATRSGAGGRGPGGSRPGRRRRPPRRPGPSWPRRAQPSRKRGQRATTAATAARRSSAGCSRAAARAARACGVLRGQDRLRDARR